MTNLKSRTITVTDEDWGAIGKASMSLGFGERGRGKAMVKLARDHNAKTEEKTDDEGS